MARMVVFLIKKAVDYSASPDILFFLEKIYMGIKKFKAGQSVVDKWYPEWGNGVVYLVKKEKVIVSFLNKTSTYNKQNIEFLGTIKS